MICYISNVENVTCILKVRKNNTVKILKILIFCINTLNIQLGEFLEILPFTYITIIELS